jgi:hypothetical protein
LRPASEVVSPSAAMMALANAGALDDPLVGGLDHLRGRHWSPPLRQIGADAADDGTKTCDEFNVLTVRAC